MKFFIRQSGQFIELGILMGLLVYLGFQIVPAHWTSIWLDREFTGWQSSVANRMATEGLQLYGDGGHSPMPPVSFVALRFLTGGESRWVLENLINFATQGLIVLTLYLAFSLYLPRPVPFLSSLASMAAFLSFGKTVLYDQITQLCVAVLALLAVVSVHPPRKPESHERRDAPPGVGVFRLALLGLLSALAVLSKQNTGGGVSIGVFVLLLLFPAGSPPGSRFRQAGIYFGFCVLAFFGVALLMSPWISVKGMIVDVYLTGSEPKGGPGELVRVLTSFGFNTLLATLFVSVPGGVILYFQSRRRAPDGVQRAQGGASQANWISPAGTVSLILAALLAVVISVALFRWSLLPYLRPYIGEALLTLGMGGSLFLVLLHRVFPGHLPESFRHAAGGLSAFTIVLLPPALLHTLSVSEFRWTVDNNPMIGVAVAVVLALALWMCGFHVRRPPIFAALTIFVFLLQASIWGGLAGQLYATQFCTERWPEIEHLRGAKIRESASGMRELIRLTRELAPDRESDAVLLLPGDPNVESWFERPEPALTSLIVFQDQYWDRYVEEDFKRLQTAPPRVIIIGPRDVWRGFFNLWKNDWGAERLIDLVQDELIPDRYEKAAEHPILFSGRMEIMDVYVLRS